MTGEPMGPEKNGLCRTNEKILRLVEDIDIMAQYASAAGKPISEDLARALAALNVFSDRKEPFGRETPLSEISEIYTMALKVHGQLIGAVAPATPESIRATERVGAGLKVKNSATNILINVTIGCLILFVVTTVLEFFGESAVTREQVFWANIIRSLKYLFAAGLGSGFYALTTAKRYILQRTFDPRYNQTYYVRFVLGLAAGTILAYFGKDLFSSTELTRQLGPGFLAIIGGYSADAVAEILQRLAETLVTIVKGSNRDQLEAREREIRTEAAAAVSREKSDMAKKLQKLLSARTAAEAGVHKEDIDKLISDLLG